MNEIERRLRDAMAARADEVEPHDEGEALERISGRVHMNRRRGMMLAGAAAAIFVVAGALVLLTRDNDDKSAVNVGTGSTASSSSPSTTTTTGPVVTPSEGPTPIWPFASSGTTFDSPEQAAKTFVVDYLGMTVARLGAVNGNDVEVFPNERGSARTVVHVEHRSSGWVVVGADADQIQVDTPKPHDAVTPTIELAGRSVAFEAQLGVELRPFGSTTPVATGSVMGGSTEMQPFHGSIDAPSTDQPLVLLLFEGDASGMQTYTKATVIPLDAAGAAAPADFVGIAASDDLVHLDFDGHLQKTLASQVALFAFSREAQLVAYSPLGETCTTRFISLTGGAVPAEFAGHPVAFSADGSALTYLVCESAPAAYVVRNLTTNADTSAAANYPPPLPPGVSDPGATVRGRFLTTAFFDGTDISSYNPSTGAVVQLVTPTAGVVQIDADASGRHLLWVDVNHDLWKWSGSEPVKVGSGFKSAAW
jgi:hypothetical protein